MMKIAFYIYHYTGKILYKIGLLIDYLRFRIIFANPMITKGTGIKSVGMPIIRLGKNSRLVIGNNFKMNDGKKNNFIGRDRKCLLNVSNGAELIIGDNVGMSSCSIVATKSIILGNNIRFGGNVVIYDSDFHSLKAAKRLSQPDPGIKKAPVRIGDNVFIGAHSIILKGVTIGTNAVVGAGSVVAKNIPDNEIWAGNPAKFIKALK